MPPILAALGERSFRNYDDVSCTIKNFETKVTEIGQVSLWQIHFSNITL